MPRQRQAKPGPSTPARPVASKLKQTTLFGFTLSSSPQISPSPSPRKSKKGKSKLVGPLSPAKNTRAKGKKRALESDDEGSSSSSSAVGAIRFEPEIIDVDGGAESEEESPHRPAKKRRIGRQGDLGHGGDSDADPLDVIKPRTKKSGAKGKQRETEKGRARPGKPDKSRKIVSEDEREEVSANDEEVEEQPKRRRLFKGERPATASESEDEDLLEEVDTNTILEDRLRSRGKKSAFQSNLEKLRRKKRGQPLESSESEALSGDEAPAPFKGARPSKAGLGDDDDSDALDDVQKDEDEEVDDSFIVEDDSQTVAPAELPSAFSMNTYQDLAHHFKIICQLLVHVAVQPAEERHDYMEKALKDVEYFSVPLQIARRKLTGMRDSLVASSVWRPEFKGPLERYPNFELLSMEFAVPACDACHLGGRMSTFEGRVSGEAYDRMGFEPLPDSDDSDEDEEEEVKRFHLGRFCARRTKVFHEFCHWEYATYQTLLREIEALRSSKGQRGFIRVAFSGAGGAKPPEDLEDADGVMEWLDQRGIIEGEWRRVKELMTRARGLEMASKKGEDVDE